LAEKILKVSGADSLRELSALLYSAASVTEDKAIQEVLKAIQEVLDALSGYRNDCEVTKAMHLLCRILRNLDSEVCGEYFDGTTTWSANPFYKLASFTTGVCYVFSGCWVFIVCLFEVNFLWVLIFVIWLYPSS